MADPIYTGETFTAYFEMWDGQLSPEKPDVRPDPAWLVEAEVSQIFCKVTKPNGITVTVNLTSGDIEPSGRDGEWRARVLADAGPGNYFVDFEGRTINDYRPVSVVKVKVKPRP